MLLEYVIYILVLSIIIIAIYKYHHLSLKSIIGIHKFTSSKFLTLDHIRQAIALLQSQNTLLSSQIGKINEYNYYINIDGRMYVITINNNCGYYVYKIILVPIHRIDNLIFNPTIWDIVHVFGYIDLGGYAYLLSRTLKQVLDEK